MCRPLGLARRPRTGSSLAVRISVIAVAVLLSPRRVHAGDPPPAYGGAPPPPAAAATPPAAGADPPPSAQSPPPAPMAPPPAFPGSASARRAAPRGGGVIVELLTDNPDVRIDMEEGGETTTVCFAPCRRVLRRNQIYVIQGTGVRSSSRFLLPDYQAQVTLDVHAGSSNRLLAGALLLGAGVVVGYVGLLDFAVGRAQPGDTLDPPADSANRADQHARTGVVLMLCGVPAAVAGLYLVLTARTSVVSSTGASFSQNAPTPSKKYPHVALTPRGLEF